MPKSANPEIPEFYVYEFSANAIPFYIGIGRAERASDRLRYVQQLMARQKQGKPVKWTLSNSVIATLIRRKIKIKLRYVRKGIPRDQARQIEHGAIQRRSNQGHLLANIQLNPNIQKSPKPILDRLLKNDA